MFASIVVTEREIRVSTEVKVVPRAVTQLAHHNINTPRLRRSPLRSQYRLSRSAIVAVPASGAAVVGIRLAYRKRSF